MSNKIEKKRRELSPQLDTKMKMGENCIPSPKLNAVKYYKNVNLMTTSVGLKKMLRVNKRFKKLLHTVT